MLGNGTLCNQTPLGNYRANVKPLYCYLCPAICSVAKRGLIIHSCCSREQEVLISPAQYRVTCKGNSTETQLSTGTLNSLKCDNGSIIQDVCRFSELNTHSEECTLHSGKLWMAFISNFCQNNNQKMNWQLQ